MSEKVTVPAGLRAKLAAANGNAVELCDEAGNVVGYAITPARMAKAEEVHKTFRSLFPQKASPTASGLKDDPRPDVVVDAKSGPEPMRADG